MDELRIEAILACFSTDGVPPEQKHVEKLKENSKLDPDEADDLLDRSITAFNNFKAFSDSPAAYVAELKKKTRQKVFVQRLAGLPEDPMPDKDEASDLETKAVAPSANVKSARGMSLPDDDDLLIDSEEPPPVPKNDEALLHSLRRIFDRNSEEFSLADADKIGSQTAPQKSYPGFLHEDVIGQMQLFTDDPEDFIAGIDEGSRPQLSPEKLSLLKALLGELARIAKATPATKPPVPPAEPVAEAEVLPAPAFVVSARAPIMRPDPAPDAVVKPEAPAEAKSVAPARAPIMHAGTPAKPVPDAVAVAKPEVPAKPAAVAVTESETADPAEKKPIVVHSLPVPPQEPPAWARKVMQMSYWKTARECIETAYAKMNDPNPDVRAKGTDDLAHWQQRMREHKEGCSGPELELFGDYMYKLMRDLKSGVDPFSEAYVRMYVNP